MSTNTIPSAIATTTTTSTSTTTAHTQSQNVGPDSQVQPVTEKNQGSFGSLFEYPTTIICSDCATVMAIPASVWLWTCSQGHPDNVREYACKTCQETCPTNLPWPAIECAKCHTTTTVPKTEIAALLKGGVYTIRSALKSAIDGPETFHCSCCNTLLLIPKGQWKCQACETMNTRDCGKCTKCTQDRYDQNIMCGSCGKSTSIPKSSIIDAFRAGFIELESGIQRSWFDVTQQPHVDCPRCKFAVKLPSTVSSTTSVTCGNCNQILNLSSIRDGTSSSSFVQLQDPSVQSNVGTNKSAGSVAEPPIESMKLSDALSEIDQTTSEFAKGPTVDDLGMNKLSYQPQTEKDEEIARLNSFANNV